MTVFDDLQFYTIFRIICIQEDKKTPMYKRTIKNNVKIMLEFAVFCTLKGNRYKCGDNQTDMRCFQSGSTVIQTEQSLTRCVIGFY